MTDNFGNGVSRVLPAESTQYDQVIFQWDRPPLDSEWNLLQQMGDLKLRTAILAGTPSGWLGNSTNAQEVYETNGLWSNWFKLKGPAWANVNGWLIPVTGTKTGTPPGQPNNTDAFNQILLDPPPSSSGESRTDFVFLEVWKARIPPNPSTLNKPSSSAVYRYGNLEGGFDYLADDIQDPDIGEESSQRVQIQYRVRVVSGLTGLSAYPDGFDPTVVKGQGAATTPTSYTFTNMATTLGDPGLWRAGDGNQNTLGTVDGYVYAIPLAIVFRRNSVGWDGDPGQNLNGGVNRNPTAVDRTGAVTWTSQATLAAPMVAGDLQFSLVSATSIPLPTSPGPDAYCRIGDEVILYSSITGTTGTILARGQLGTVAEAHPAGTEVRLVSGRPDGLFADQIARQDIMDVRHVVNPNGFNYRSLLAGSLDQLLQGKLKTDWKRSGGGTVGTTVLYQDKISTSTAVMGTTRLDAPDNVRQVFSDAVVFQAADLILKPYTTPGTGFCTETWDLQAIQATHTCTVANQWAPSNTITLPLSSLDDGLPGSDSDQVRWLDDDWSFSLRVDGEATAKIKSNTYGYDVAIVGGNLVITLGTNFPATSKRLFVKAHYQIGPGRGLSRRPDAINAVHLLSTAPQGYVLRTPYNEPSGEIPLTVSWAPLWSRYRRAMWANLLPSTAAAYVDQGSKTVILTPWRAVQMPAQVKTQDGGALNGNLGLMPGGDPLGLFSSAADPTAATKNIYIQIPRNLLPTWGEVKVPVLRQDTGMFSEGINFGILARKGSSVGPGEKNYVVRNVTFITTSPYNTTGSNGIRKFTDTRGLGRQGLEFPPFYGIARLFAVYESVDYIANQTAYDVTTLEPRGAGATNLLRQDLQGATFWIEEGTNGDSTFILNADCLDLSKTSLPSFSAGDYVVEVSLFGFDRGAFTSGSDPRIVLSRDQQQVINPVRTENVDPAAGLATEDKGLITAPTLVIPAPASTNESFGITYSRTPYQGDCLGTQLNHTDFGYLPGPLLSSQAYQLASTDLDQANLSRPRQKVLEVLDAMGFVTTLGTGRLTGDSPDIGTSTEHPLSRVGMEDKTYYPPSSGSAARPALLQDGLNDPDVREDIGTAYLGCTERLPLGALWRDKDFIGAAPTTGQLSLYYNYLAGPGIGMSGLAVAQSTQETYEEPCQTADLINGSPSQVIIHVDGEQGNYGLLTNFRTTRGGSAFSATGRPGGELRSYYGETSNGRWGTGVLTGTAYLVRVSPFQSGLTTLTHGGELMMLVATTAKQMPGYSVTLETLIGTNGTNEGNSACDLYRVPGRPLERDNVKLDINPDLINLTHPLT
jgi:hypothetical protein